MFTIAGQGTWPGVALLSMILGVLYISGRLIYNVFFHPLARFPGPWLSRATRLPYMKAILRGQYAAWARIVHEQYGDIVRIAPDELSFITAESWAGIYGSRPSHGQNQKDDRFYHETIDGAPSIALSNDSDHSRFRRLLSHAFSDGSIQKQEPLVMQYITLLMERLQAKVEGGPAHVDMVSWFDFTTFDITGDMAFGESFGCLRSSAHHPWMKFITSNFKEAAYTNVLKRIPGARTLFDFMVPKAVIQEKATHAEFTKAKVRARLSMSTDRPDFFSHILKRAGTEKGMSFPELVANTSTLMVAGSETTASVLSGALFYLLKNPPVLQKLKDEIRSAFHSDKEIALDACSKLRYTPAVIKEALRMYPPTPMGLPRVVGSNGALIAGEFIPQGTTVSVPQFAAYQNPRNFTAPQDFAPERFLGDPRFENDMKDVLHPFSFGPRNCIGRNLANMQLQLILVNLIFRFDIHLDGRSCDWATDQKVYHVWEKPPLWVWLTGREGVVADRVTSSS